MSDSRAAGEEARGAPESAPEPDAPERAAGTPRAHHGKRRSRRTRRRRGGARLEGSYAAPGLLRRLLATHWHLFGLFFGAIVTRARAKRRLRRRHGPVAWLERAVAAIARPLLRPDLAALPFPAQLRRRLELLGPTYVKLGQILSLREDILPTEVTQELRGLLSRLPAVPFPAIRTLVEHDLGRPLNEMFVHVDARPIGSASIAQIHRATTVHGDDVVLKVVKPGVPELLRRDARLLRLLAHGLQLVLPRYMPQRIIQEFTEYTLREVDLRREADNAETFAANFADVPDIIFPAVHREYSGAHVLCMSYMEGLRPDSPEARALPLTERERLVDLGAEAIIRMIYQDGFFHADLHPGNLLVLSESRVGFIDLGMVGRLDGDLRRALLYYYYSLVMGDAENAARYLSAVAIPQRGGDPTGFRREVAEISSRWRLAASFEGFSLARLVLESLARGARYRMYFPVELVLMVKALITYEGVGHLLLPGFDVAQVSRVHIRHVVLHQFNLMHLAREELRSAPDVVDALVKLPLLVTEGVRMLEATGRRPTEPPLTGLQGTLLAGFALVAGALLLGLGRPWPVWAALFALAAVLTLLRRR
ncbi:MAG TPA: AarF/UbiB family protein [Gemmatimonadaceae bacterium]|nr:AarF/UbiB family protein [Gemmatimonadaceae bacterium]